MEEFEREYPEKPEMVKSSAKRGHISVTILSMIIFAITFSFILDDYFLIAALLGVLLFHELGHFALMKLFGYEHLNMLFIPFIGAMVSGRKKIYSQVESSLMVLAGPLPGIILGAFLLLYDAGSMNHFSIQIGVLLIFLNVLNLLPIDPLDGGQLVKIIYSNYELAQVIILLITSLALAGIGLWMNSWLLIIFGLFLGFRIKSNHKLYLIRKEMRDLEIEYESNYEDLSNESYADIKSIIIDHTPVLNELKEHNEEDKYNQIVAKQVENVLFPPTDRDASPGHKFIFGLLWIGGITISIYALYSIDLNSIIHAFQDR